MLPTCYTCAACRLAPKHLYQWHLLTAGSQKTNLSASPYSCCMCLRVAHEKTSMKAMMVIATSVIMTMHASVMGPTLSSKKPTCFLCMNLLRHS